MNRSLVRLGLVILVLACGSPSEPLSGRVTLTPAKADYVGGETVVATLENRSELTLTYSECSLELERLVGARWTVVPRTRIICLGILNLVPPGAEAAMSLWLEPERPADAYRLTASLGHEPTGRVYAIHSRIFTVTSTPP
jgi:hypothetical protein